MDLSNVSGIILILEIGRDPSVSSLGIELPRISAGELNIYMAFR